MKYKIRMLRTLGVTNQNREAPRRVEGQEYEVDEKEAVALIEASLAELVTGTLKKSVLIEHEPEKVVTPAKPETTEKPEATEKIDKPGKK